MYIVLVNIEGKSGKAIDRNTYDVSDHFIDDMIPVESDQWWTTYDYSLYSLIRTD